MIVYIIITLFYVTLGAVGYVVKRYSDKAQQDFIKSIEDFKQSIEHSDKIINATIADELTRIRIGLIGNAS